MFLCNLKPRTKCSVLEKFYQILLHEHLKAALDKPHFFLKRVKFLGHIIDTNTITPLKFRIDAIQKLQPPSNITKIQGFHGMSNFLTKYVYQLQSTILRFGSF